LEGGGVLLFPTEALPKFNIAGKKYYFAFTLSNANIVALKSQEIKKKTCLINHKITSNKKYNTL